MRKKWCDDGEEDLRTWKLNYWRIAAAKRFVRREIGKLSRRSKRKKSLVLMKEEETRPSSNYGAAICYCFITFRSE